MVRWKDDVGDLLQLPPVNGVPVFQRVPSTVVALRLGCITTINIWKETIVYDELTITSHTLISWMKCGEAFHLRKQSNN